MNKKWQVIYRYSSANKTSPLPMFITYQEPRAICYTKEVGFEKDQLLFQETAVFNSTRMVESKLSMSLMFHQKGRLLKEWSDGNYYSLSSEQIQRGLNNKGYQIKLKLTWIGVLKKRSTSRYPCKDLVDEDKKLMQDAIMEVGCIPTFWGRLISYSSFVNTNTAVLQKCTEKEQFLKIYSSTYNMLQGMRKKYDPPCINVEILNRIEKRPIPLKLHKEPSLTLKFQYLKEEYKYIENRKSFDDESLLSMTGGYVGIFLGVSLMQMPSLLESLLRLFESMFKHEGSATCQQENPTNVPMEAQNTETLSISLQQVQPF